MWKTEWQALQTIRALSRSGGTFPPRPQFGHSIGIMCILGDRILRATSPRWKGRQADGQAAVAGSRDINDPTVRPDKW